MTRPDLSPPTARIEAELATSRRDVDRLFRWLLPAQWALAVVLAFALRADVTSAFVFGGALCITPLVLVARQPGWWLTRHAVAATQMLFCALFIHVASGRVEAHFHVFGSLALLAFYRDCRVLATATIFVAADHLVRGWLAPHSIYGIANPEWWRFLEHAAWVLFESVVLVFGIVRSLRDLSCIADREAALAGVHSLVEQQVAERTAELAASREQFRSLVESTEAIPWEFLPQEQRSSYVAPQIEALLGHPVVRYEDPGFYRSVIHPEDVERFELAMHRGFVDGVDFQQEIRLVARDGRIVHVRSVVAIVRRGETTVLRGVMFDISHQKQLEEELRQAHKLESIGRLAAGVAHGINTPLQYIGNNVEFLALATSRLLAALKAIESLASAATSEDERVVELIRRAKLGVLEARVPAAIAATLDGLRAVERIVGTLQQLNGPKAPLAPAIVVDIAHALTMAIDPIRADAPRVEILLTVGSSVGTVLGDPDRLGLAFTGLVRNAVEACLESGRDDARVRVVALRRAHLVEIQIHDDGCGMPDAVRQRIFDPFFTTKGVGHGCGEGLNRIRDIIIGEHGGELSCERSSPVGTTFVVRLAAAEATARVA